jgi:hypothetical protein
MYRDDEDAGDDAVGLGEDALEEMSAEGVEDELGIYDKLGDEDEIDFERHDDIDRI